VERPAFAVVVAFALAFLVVILARDLLFARTTQTLSSRPKWRDLHLPLSLFVLFRTTTTMGAPFIAQHLARWVGRHNR
jgi:hypothetical protein